MSSSIPEADFQPLQTQIIEIKASLRANFPKATPEQYSAIEDHLFELQATIKLYQIMASFRSSIQNEVKHDWIPKGQIEQVVRASCDHQYREDDIESVFYENGGINGLLVLYCGTRNNNALFAQINGLPLEVREQLAKQCGVEKINDFIPPWIRMHETTKVSLGVPSQPSRLPRLDRFAQDKEKRQPQGKRSRTESTSSARHSPRPNEPPSGVHLSTSDPTLVTGLQPTLPSLENMLHGQNPGSISSNTSPTQLLVAQRGNPNLTEGVWDWTGKQHAFMN